MGNKKELKKIAKNTIKILDSGKIKLPKGGRIRIKDVVDASAENAIISRLEGVIDNGVEKFDMSHSINVEHLIINPVKIASIISMEYSRPTIVVLVDKKKSLDFDFCSDGVIGDMLRSSTLGPTYNKIKNDWKNLNKSDKSTYTNIMFIPDILVFTDGYSILKEPFYTNLIMISVPTLKLYMDEASKDNKINSDEMISRYLDRIYGDIFDAATKIEDCENLIVNPFDISIFDDNYNLDRIPKIMATWNYLTNVPKIKKSIGTVWFSIDDDVKYIMAVASKDLVRDEYGDFYLNDNTAISNNDDKDADDITEEIVSDLRDKIDKRRKSIEYYREKLKLDDEDDDTDDDDNE